MTRSLLVLGAISLAALIFALAIGSVNIAPSELWKVIQGEGSALHRTLLLTCVCRAPLRLSRPVAC